MQSIPQDIIGEIVEHLHGDKQTLMICSLVSQQFEPSCRKHLFSYIELDLPSTICHFHSLLSENPNLASLVRHLRIYVETSRFGSGVHLPWILGMLTHIQWLELGRENLFTMNWAWLPREAQSALLKICQSPSLSTLDIGHIVGLPPALFKNIYVRKLGVHYVLDHDYHTPMTELDLTGLEALDICIMFPYLIAKNLSLDLYTGATNSRQLSIRTYSDGRLMMETVLNVMEKAFKTLKYVRWENYRKRIRDLSPGFTLATLSNLQSLTFSIIHISDEDITSAIDLLTDPAVSRNLEQLTFIFNFSGMLGGWQIPVETVVRSVGWEILDVALGTSRFGMDSPLHTVSVYVESFCMDADAGGLQLQRKLEARLPILVEKGVRVSTRLCHNGRG